MFSVGLGEQKETDEKNFTFFVTTHRDNDNEFAELVEGRHERRR